MNFQAVVNQFNVDQGKALVKIKALLLEIKGMGLSKNGKQYMDVKVQDQNGESHKVRLYAGKQNFPPVQEVNQWHLFDVSAYQGTYEGKPYTGFSGFYSGRAQGAQSQAVPSYSGVQQAGQSTKTEPDWDKIAEGKTRCSIVCAGIKSGQLECKTPAAVEDGLDIVFNGIKDEEPDDNPFPQPAPDEVYNEDIPF